MKKLVITGMGAVTPIGIGVEEYWQNLLAGKTGIDCIDRPDFQDVPVKIAGQVKAFNPKDFMAGKLAGQMDRFMQMAFVAAEEAIVQAGGFSDPDSNPFSNPYRRGITVGTALNGFGTITGTQSTYDSAKVKKVGPRFLPKSLGNVCASQIAIAHNIHGPSMTLNTACASGGDALTLGVMMIQAGMADVVVAVGADSALEPIMLQSLASAQALSNNNNNPHKACRPFDIDRDGFVSGEGAGAIVIESEDHAKARGAVIHAYLSGWGNNTDAYHPVTPRPDGEGEILCMKQAIETAGIEPCEIGYINAHGTATVKGDICETEAVKRVFGDNTNIPVSSTKAATGHMMGAGGITEVITCIQALKEGVAPGTLNLDNRDSLCNLNYIAENTKTSDIRYAMSNAFGFGGQNSSIIVGKAD